MGISLNLPKRFIYRIFRDVYTTGSASDEKDDVSIAGSSARRKGTKEMRKNSRPNGMVLNSGSICVLKDFQQS